MEKDNSRRNWAIIIFVAAFALRLIYFLQTKSNYPGWDTPTIDPLYHDLWAKQIASGDILGSGPFFRAPLYAYFLGIIYALAGPSLAVSKIVQHLIGSISCSLIFLFADRYFGRPTAIIAGLTSAFYWVFIYFEDELLLDSLLVLLSILIIWTLMRAVEKPSLKRFFLSGLIIGIASITRPNFLVMLPVVLIWMLIYYSGKYLPAIGRFAVLALGCVLMIIPVTVRNYVVGDDSVLIASQGGINFYIGNNRYADGSSAIMPEFGPTWQYADCEFLAKKESARLGQEMKPSEVSSFYYGKGLKFIIGNPGRWLKLMLRKLDFFWNAYEISNNQNLYFFRRFASITLILPPLFFLVSPLSIVGIWLLFKREKKYHIIGYFIIGYMLTVILFFVNSRFRLPVLPFLIILAASSAVWIFKRIGLRNIRSIYPPILAFLLLFALTNIDFYGITHTSFAMSHFSLGNVYLKKGMNQKALEEYTEATKLADCVPSAHVNMGIIYFSQLNFNKARDEFIKEIDKCGGSSKAHNNLSVIYRLNGDNELALREARLAIFESPQHLEAYVNEILALRLLGETDSASIVADSLTIMFPSFLPGHYFRGKIALEKHDYALAESEFHFVANQGPANILEKYDLSTIYTSQTPYGYKAEKMPGLAYYELGLMEVSRGQIDSALTFFQKTTEILPDYPDGWTNLALALDHKKFYKEALDAFRKSTDLDPDNPVTLYNLGLTLGKIGYFPEAAQTFRMALQLKPDFPEARQKLQITESLLDSLSEQ